MILRQRYSRCIFCESESRERTTLTKHTHDCLVTLIFPTSGVSQKNSDTALWGALNISADHSTCCGHQSSSLAANNVRLGKDLTPQPAIKRILTVLLRHLDLRGCVNITNIGLKCVFSLQQLQHLVVCRDQITDSVVSGAFSCCGTRVILTLACATRLPTRGLRMFFLAPAAAASFSLV